MPRHTDYANKRTSVRLRGHVQRTAKKKHEAGLKRLAEWTERIDVTAEGIKIYKLKGAIAQGAEFSESLEWQKV